MSSKPTIVVDVDGTLCEPMDSDYMQCVPRPDMIRTINRLYDSGAQIVVFTARGMRRNNGDVNACYFQFYDRTKKWLDENGVKYHELIMGKPAGDYYLDDKSITFEDILNLKITV